MSAGVDEARIRSLTPSVLGILVRRGADFAAAEDALQDALVEAVRVWPADPPRDPKGWLVTVAWRRFLDAARADAARRRREDLADEEPPPGPAPAADDTLNLYFLCAHPSLTPSSAVALTLRAVGGLTTRQIAQAYLVPEATMAQRISRAKRTVSGVRFDRRGDVATVLRVLYLVFNEGYSGDVDLAAEAIRLTRQLASSIDHPEVSGLLALMLLHHARRAARTAPDGSLVPLAEQDRTRWDTGAIAEGVHILQAALARDRLGSSRPRQPSPPSTPTRPPPRRPTGCRSSSGTTNSCFSRTARWSGSTAPWPSARPTGRARVWRRSRPWTTPCPATTRWRRTSTSATAI